MNFSRQWCEMLAQQYAKSGVEKSPAALLLQYGAEYPDRRPAPWRGTPKACYANAQYLVKRRPGWRYVEGYATALVPIEHAWCLNPDGQVIDPTLEQASDYFGVAIDMAVVRRIRRLPGGRSYSVLFAWWKWKRIYPELARYLEANCNLTKDVTR
jgi:hypothetical protein